MIKEEKPILSNGFIAAFAIFESMVDLAFVDTFRDKFRPATDDITFVNSFDEDLGKLISAPDFDRLSLQTRVNFVKAFFVKYMRNF